MKVLQYSGQNHDFLRNHAIPSTDFGIFNVFPFRPSLDFSVFTLFPPSFPLTVLAATFLLEATALEAVDFVLAAAFLAVDLTLEAADFVFVAAFLAVDFAFDFALAVLFTASSNFLEIAALSPAFANPFIPAFFTPEADLIPESLSFLAVALPTPGKAINAARGSFFGLAAISSPDLPCKAPMMNPSPIRGILKA